jgi:hypothetical protein
LLFARHRALCYSRSPPTTSPPGLQIYDVAHGFCVRTSVSDEGLVGVHGVTEHTRTPTTGPTTDASLCARQFRSRKDFHRPNYDQLNSTCSEVHGKRQSRHSHRLCGHTFEWSDLLQRHQHSGGQEGPKASFW